MNKMDSSLVGAAPGGHEEGVHGAEEAGQARRERLQVLSDAHDEPVQRHLWLSTVRQGDPWLVKPPVDLVLAALAADRPR